MALYRCYFVTSTDHIAGAQEVEADSDVDAIEQARTLVATQPQCTGELWLRNSLVRRYIRPRAPCGSAPNELLPPHEAGDVRGTAQ